MKKACLVCLLLVSSIVVNNVVCRKCLAVMNSSSLLMLVHRFQITIGRSTKDCQVDVDLKLEGPAWKISRKQGVIKLRNSGEFFIANEGKRPMFIDGNPVRK